jgi:hypothetical protein
MSEIKQFCNLRVGSDILPYEVIARKTPRKAMVRAMRAEMAFTPECHTGGFCCNVSNNSGQTWNFFHQPEATPIAVRWSDKFGCWRDSGGNKYRMEDKPRKFYDFNF